MAVANIAHSQGRMATSTEWRATFRVIAPRQDWPVLKRRCSHQYPSTAWPQFLLQTAEKEPSRPTPGINSHKLSHKNVH